MTTIEQAKKAKEYLLPMRDIIPASIGISKDSKGYFIKVYLSEPTTYSIPSSIGQVRVEIEIVGIPEKY